MTCQCSKVKESEWDMKDHKWKEKYFYVVKQPCFFYKPLNIEKTFDKLFIGANVWDLVWNKKSPLILMKSGMFRSKLMLEVKKPKHPNKHIQVFKNAVFRTRIHRGEWNKIGRTISLMRKKLKKNRRKIKAIYFWYLTCPDCTKNNKKHQTVVFARTR